MKIEERCREKNVIYKAKGKKRKFKKVSTVQTQE